MDNLRKEFRFHATDNELLGYLREEEGFHRFPSCGRRLISSRSNRRAYLPHFLDKWFFISKRLQSHPLSCNTVKQLTGGYWKEAGKPQPLKKVGDTIISTKRTLKFTSNTENPLVRRLRSFASYDKFWWLLKPLRRSYSNWRISNLLSSSSCEGAAPWNCNNRWGCCYWTSPPWYLREKLNPRMYELHFACLEFSLFWEFKYLKVWWSE